MSVSDFHETNAPRTIFIIVNPIELLNAIEWAIDRGFCFGDIDIVFLRKGAGRRKDIQTEFIIRNVGFRKVEVVEIYWPVAMRRFGYLAYLTRVVRCRNRLDELVSGVDYAYNYVLSGRHPLALHLANKIVKDNMIVVEGGSNLVQVFNRFNTRQSGSYSGVPTFFERMAGIISEIPVKSSLWTSYQNVVWPYGDIKRHSYSRISGRQYLFSFLNIDFSFFESDVVVIGEPLRGQSQHSYLTILRRVVDFVHPSRCIYFPHPSEGEELVETIEEIGLYAVCSEWPIELVLLSSEAEPYLIVGNRSSALINLSRMRKFCGKVKTYLESSSDGVSVKYKALASELKSAGVGGLFKNDEVC